MYYFNLSELFSRHFQDTLHTYICLPAWLFTLNPLLF